MRKLRKKIKRIPARIIVFIVILVVALGYLAPITKSFAESFETGERCLKLEFRDNGFPAAVVINSHVWNSENDEFHTDDGNYTIVILAGKRGDDFPQLSTPGGFRDQENVTVDSRPNLGEDPLVEGDEYRFTITLTNYGINNGCEFLGGIEITPGPEPTVPYHDEETEITISISGEELEYHYVEDKPDEADVTYFKFAINSMISDDLVPFTFGNAEYTYIEGKEPPKNVSKAETKQPIQYRYRYNDSGYVEFCVNGGGTDEYTKIEINGVDYADQAPHTQREVFERFGGGASTQFCIENVPYASTYDVVVEGRQVSDDKKVAGFSWSYLSHDRSPDVSEEEEGDFAHGKVEFVHAKFIDDENQVYEFSTPSAYNAGRYHNTGEIFQWANGDKQYPEEDRRMAGGNVLAPYGTELTVRIIPDAGYQLTSMTTSEHGFQATEEPGVYKIELTRENLTFNEDGFRLEPTFTKIGSEVQATSNKVKGGTIETEEEVENGSIKLAVTDANVSNDRQNAFADKASEQGFTVSNIVDISLYNSIYKGGKKDNNGNYLSWDTELNNLSKKANIELELQDDMAGKEVALVHEIHDGDTITGYEFVETNFDSETNTINFEEDNFSNFAIVIKDVNNEPQEQEEDQARIIYNTRSDDHIEDAIINKGDKAPIPRDPIHEGGFAFEGWFTTEACNEEYDFNLVVNVDRLELFAKWAEPENPEPGEEPERDTPYTVEDDKENIISFMEEEGHTYNFEITDYLSFTKEEVMAAVKITSEQYDQIFNGVKGQAEEKGTFLFFFDINVYEEVEPDPNDPEDDGKRNIHEGPFTVKIRMTDELKKYTNFKMYYVNEDFTLDDEAIEFEASEGGKYLVGTLEHLSPYVLVGDVVSSNPKTPQTGDRIMLYISMLGLGIIGIAVVGICIKKKKLN